MTLGSNPDPCPGRELPPTSPYVPLWCKSNYSFLEGASHPEELIEACHRNGHSGLGAHRSQRGLRNRQGPCSRPSIGCPLDCRDPRSAFGMDRRSCCWSGTMQGYRNLCRLLTDGHLRSAKGEFKLGWREVCRSNPGLIALWGGRSHPESPTRRPDPEPVLERLQEAFEEPNLRPDRQTSASGRSNAGGAAPEAGPTDSELSTVAAVEVLYHCSRTAPPAGCSDLYPGRSDALHGGRAGSSGPTTSTP